MKVTKKIILYFGLCVLTWGIINFIALYPAYVEVYYSKTIYPFISNILRVTFFKIPFSIGDLIYIALVGYLLISLIKGIIKRKFFSSFLLKFLKVGLIFYVLFYINWGLNYFRQPINHYLQFKNTNYTDIELFNFTKKLIFKINEVQFAITKNDTIIVNNPKTKKQIKQDVFRAYKNITLANAYNFNTLSNKHSLLSTPLTYMGFSGYLNPFTGEAQVNKNVPKNTYPATALHEIAHQTGIASENEANFVAYLTGTASNNLYYQYSSYLLALRNCLSDVYRKNPKEYKNQIAKLNYGVIKDIKNIQEFWLSYDNVTEKYFKIFYDYFLKANQQKDGIKSYNKMVKLLINYHKKNKLPLQNAQKN